MNYLELADQVKAGEVNALKAYIELKETEKELAEALKVVQSLAIDEAGKYPEKSFKAFGAIIEKKSNPATWDYSEVAAYSQAKEKLKYIEKIAQIGGGVDPTTGEEIGKAIRIEGKANISVKLLKQEAA